MPKNKDPVAFGLFYKQNDKEWMTKEIFSFWLDRLSDTNVPVRDKISMLFGI